MTALASGGLRALDRPVAICSACRVVLAVGDTVCRNCDDVVIQWILSGAADRLNAHELALRQPGSGDRTTASGRHRIKCIHPVCLRHAGKQARIATYRRELYVVEIAGIHIPGRAAFCHIRIGTLHAACL
ncbi:hypothetical protein XaplCFBP3123_13350 [Xanthomonas arboricola pv. populi]|nr:hypothetical protein XaplCFBP3123_13350 [Xanthomonas arboricola pv. populi]